MRLTDLNPRWVRSGGEGISDAQGNPVPERQGIGMTFECPCGCGIRGFVHFSNPLDGQPPSVSEEHSWERTGDNFETLTLHPSIHRAKANGGCGWHGWIKDGEVTGQVES